jgi:hypothetical protein
VITYHFWLGKLNQFNGNFVNAEMVKAFIASGEYRQRFGLRKSAVPSTKSSGYTRRALAELPGAATPSPNRSQTVSHDWLVRSCLQ